MEEETILRNKGCTRFLFFRFRSNFLVKTLWNPSKASNKASKGEIVKEGKLKKLKQRSMRKKYFVLRGDTLDNPARLEYYDSERKFKSNKPPKRSIVLKTCFNINKKTGTKENYVIALHTKNDCLSIVLDSEEEMENWLKPMLKLQFGEDSGGSIRPNFDHVWQVTVYERDLGSKFGILGPYRLCLKDQTLSLVGLKTDEKINSYKFSLQKIKSCSAYLNFFYLQFGSGTCPGEFLMTADDKNMAENIHTTIYNEFRKFPKKDDFSQIKMRYRSYSANRDSKLTMPIQRWYTDNGLTDVRVRSDSMPSRVRPRSECWAQHPNFRNLHFNHVCQDNKSGMRYSLPGVSSPLRVAHYSAGSDLSMDSIDTIEGQWEDSRYFHSLSLDKQAILEKNSDEYSHRGGIRDVKLNNSEPYYNTDVYRKNDMPLKSNTQSQGSHLDIYRDSSPLDTENYLTMSPAKNRGKISDHMVMMIINHIRGSSLADDDYVPMRPQASNHGYVNIDYGLKRNKTNKYYSNGEFLTKSSRSIHSGRENGKLSEYRLDKVICYLTAED